MGEATMTITRGVVKDSVPGYEIAYLMDQRSFEVEMNAWTFRGKWSRSLTEVNGVIEKKNNPCIDMVMFQSDTRLKVMLVLNDQEDSYRLHISQKENARGAWREHKSPMLDALLEKFWQRYRSLDFQVNLHEHAELEALDEIRQLEERIQLLKDYALNLKRQREELLA
jgi:hypothetical protein